MLTKKLARELFDYDKDGFLVWRKRPESHFKSKEASLNWNKIYPGRRAGSRCSRYRSIFYRIRGERIRCSEHRAVWVWHNGHISFEIDHIDRNGFNNKIENLREATSSQNKRNIPNITGRYKGVSFEKNRVGRKKWKAGIKDGGETITIGRYETEEEAARAYDDKAKKLHGEFACLNFK